MGAVTARVAGVEEVVVCAPGRAPGDPRGVRAVRRRRGLPDGRRAGGRPRSPTGPSASPRVDVIAGPGQPLRAGGQAPGLAATSASTASSGPSDVLVVAGGGRRPGARRARPARPGRARRGHDRRRGERRRRRCSTRSPERLRRATSDAVARPRRRAGPRRRARLRRGVRARAPRARRRGGGGARAARAQRRLRLRRARRARPRSATTSRARTTRCRRAARRASRQALSPRHFRRRMGEVHIGDAAAALARRGRAGRPRGGLRRPRRFDGGPRMEAAMTRTAEIARATKETDVPLSLALDGTGAGTRATGVGFLDHMLDLLARHGRLDLDVAGDRRPARPARTTPPRTRASRSGRRSTRRSATAPGSTATATRSCRWTRRARAARSTSPGGRCCVFEARSSRPGATGGFDHELAEEFFRAVATNAQLTVHLDARGGHERAPHDRGAVQGVRARAARGGRARPDRDRRAVDEGHAHRVIAIVDYGMGNRRSVFKALERVGGEPELTRDPDGCARPTGSSCRASARSRRRCGGCGRRASTS